MNKNNLFQDKVRYTAKLPTSVLNIDSTYQKPLSKPHVKRIVEKFNPMGVGHIEVSRRNDGTYWVFDGQHRTAVYRELGIKEIDCIVYEGLSVVDEANGYLYKNTTMKQTQSQKFKVEIQANDPDAILIDATMRSLGLRAYVKGEGGQIMAISEVKKIYAKYGADRLREVLSLTKEGFGDDVKAYQAFVLGGINEFIERFGNDEKYSRTHFIKRLKATTLEGFMSMSAKYQVQPSTSKKRAIELTAQEVFNHRKSPENKLQ